MISQRVAARAVSAARSLSSVATFSHDQLIKFPREEEGNQYSITRSVNTDGVVPSAKVYRNARNATLQQYLKTKVQGNVAKIDAFPSDTSLEVREAGDSISHGEFADVATQVKKALGATGVDLLVEDAAAVSCSKNRRSVVASHLFTVLRTARNDEDVISYLAYTFIFILTCLSPANRAHTEVQTLVSA